jgi:AcrR family transcriptional regulator
MVSNKNKNDGPKRPYRLKARAERQEEVHRRITKATVDLHRTVGPARTTVSEIAKLAGVQRATVYNHFPTDLELIDACSSHWVADNPPPDPATWAEIEDPGRRLEAALTAMYGYYDRGKDMLENVLRDAPLVPALEEINRRKWWPLIEGLVDLLSRGWVETADRVAHPEARPPGGPAGPPASGAPGDQAGAIPLRASLHVALDFFTWQTLARSGLSNEEAARLATKWVRAGA